MTSRICIVLLGLLLAQPAAAQTVVDSVSSDLNGDGLRERFTLLDDGDGSANLIVEDTGYGRVSAPDIAWIGGPGQRPELDLAPNGSVRLTSMNEAVGRNRWRMTLTIAHRSGDYQVAGFTYEWYDTLDLNAAGTCDLNLLNGKGIRQLGQGAKQNITHNVAARPVWQWTDSIQVPQVCGAN